MMALNDYRSALIQSRVVMFQATLGRAFGVLSGLYLSRLLARWDIVGDAWITVHSDVIEWETCMSGDEQQDALNDLKELGIVDVKAGPDESVKVSLHEDAAIQMVVAVCEELDRCPREGEYEEYGGRL